MKLFLNTDWNNYISPGNTIITFRNNIQLVINFLDFQISIGNRLYKLNDLIFFEVINISHCIDFLTRYSGIIPKFDIELLLHFSEDSSDSFASSKLRSHGLKR
ncbi:hypothetical protein D3C73_1244580 [compost metagenome]